MAGIQACLAMCKEVSPRRPLFFRISSAVSVLIMSKHCSEHPRLYKAECKLKSAINGVRDYFIVLSAMTYRSWHFVH